MCVRNGAVVHAWCLMSNHYHLLLVQAQLSPDLIFAATGIPFALGTNALNTIFTDPYGRSTNRETTVVVAPKAYQYDANGNLTNDGRMAYFWNDENRLVAVRSAKTGALIQENRYDGLGRRRERVEFDAGVGVTNRYLYQDWMVLAVTDGAGNVLETYTHGADLSGRVGGGAGGIGGILASTQVGGAAYYHYDFNGNVVSVSGSTQTQLAKYTYGPFGEVLLEDGLFDSRYQFSTKEYDSTTGLNYYGYRYYSPELGRWISSDPQNEIGSLNVIYKDVLADLRQKRALADAARIQNANQNPEITPDILAYLNQKYRTEFVLPSAVSSEPDVLMVIMAVDPNLYLFVVNNPVFFVDVDGRDWWPPSKWPIWPKPKDPGTWPIPGKPTCKKVKICGKEVYLCYWKNPDPDPQPDDPKVCCWISIPW